VETQLQLGATINTLTKHELGDQLAAHEAAREREYARSMKYLRLTPVSVVVSGSAFTMDGTRFNIGPREGFIWSFRRLSVDGLTASATPDVANLYRNNTTGIRVWQFNGNNFAYTFGKGEMLLLPGETISLVNSGTIAATGNITLSGDYFEVAAEQVFKLF
jgi:hypothetical protein